MLRCKSNSTCSGQALAELAIVLPLMVILTLGALDFSRIYYHSQAVEAAASAGAQYGCVSRSRAADGNAISQAALAQTRDIAQRSPVVVSSVSGDAITVNVSATYTTCVSWPGLPHTINVSRSAIMRVLN